MICLWYPAGLTSRSLHQLLTLKEQPEW
jgi:hypothetical protein